MKYMSRIRSKKVVLAMDVMNVNGLPFMVSTSLKVDLVTAEFMPEMKIVKLKAGVEQAIRVYHNKGLHVVMSIADG